MDLRTITLTGLAVAATALGGAATASASSTSLGLNTSNVGEHVQVDATTFFFPRSSVSWLRGTLLDDAGRPGNSCWRAAEKTVVEPEWHVEQGIACPAGSEGWFTWDVHATENTQFKSVVVGDDTGTSPSESNVVTMLTGPELKWDGMWAGYRKSQIEMWTDSEEYAGTITVKQGGRVVASKAVSGRHGGLMVKVARKGKRCKGCLKAGGTFVATVTPNDTRRWVTMTATGVSKRLRQGDGTPVLG